MNDKVQEFFDFCKEREIVRQLRFVYKQPAPWTEDPILRDHHFCNVHRGDDRVSQWILHNVIHPTDGDPQNLIWKVSFCRIFNRIDTLTRIGIPSLEDFDPKGLTADLEAIKSDGRSICGPAYRIHNQTGMTRIETCVDMLENVYRRIPSLTRGLEEVSDLKEAWNAVTDLHNFGPFLGFQIVWDLSYSRTLWCEEVRRSQFAYLGPGAVPGLKSIFPAAQTTYQQHERLRWLCDHQSDYLPSDFPYLSLWDCEHCTCEWRKYLNLGNGGGRSRKFRKGR